MADGHSRTLSCNQRAPRGEAHVQLQQATFLRGYTEVEETREDLEQYLKALNAEEVEVRLR